MDTSHMIKVQMCGSRPQDSETLWATPLGSNLYRLENSPFFAYGVSWLDIVEALKSDISNTLEFVQCLRKSGNRTMRVIFEASRLTEAPAQEILRNLEAMGCSYEGMQPRLVSLNVPREVDLDVVAEFLTSQSGIEWEYADPTYDEVSRARQVRQP